jgi:hypothetical protein
MLAAGALGWVGVGRIFRGLVVVISLAMIPRRPMVPRVVPVKIWIIVYLKILELKVGYPFVVSVDILRASFGIPLWTVL